MIRHPNAGGVLVLGLGCENSNIPVLMDYIGAYDEDRVKFLRARMWRMRWRLPWGFLRSWQLTQAHFPGRR